MTASTQKIKLTPPQLALMEWLAELPGRRVYTTGRGSGTYLYEVGAAPGDGSGKRAVVRSYPSEAGDPDAARASDLAFLLRLGGRDRFDVDALRRHGLSRNLNHLLNPAARSGFVAKLERDPFHYSDTVHVLTREGNDWWLAHGAGQRERQVARDAERRAASERVIVIGARCRVSPEPTEAMRRAADAGIAVPDMSRVLVRPYATATVLRETEGRLYVGDVRPLGPEAESYAARPIKGRPPNLFVERSDVMVDGTTLAAAGRLAELDREYADDVARVALDTLRDVVPRLVEAEMRMRQKLSERADMLAELLAEMRADAPGAPDSGPRDGAAPAGVRP